MTVATGSGGGVGEELGVSVGTGVFVAVGSGVGVSVEIGLGVNVGVILCSAMNKIILLVVDFNNALAYGGAKD
jgi:hypothetical protein